MLLTSSQLNQFARDGYVVVQAALTPAQVTLIAAEADEIYSEISGLHFDGAHEVGHNLRGTEVFANRIVWAAAAKPALLALGRCQAILQPVQQLLGSPSADHLINQLHAKRPGDGTAFLWHQDEQNRRRFDPDWSDRNGCGSFVQTLAALDPCTPDNGPLTVLPGSHRWGYLHFDTFFQTAELQSFLQTRGIAVDVATLERPLLVDAGDIVFMHPHVVHSSSANRSCAARRMFLNGFSYPGANRRAYPGVGSGKRIALCTGLEIETCEHAPLPCPTLTLSPA